MKPFEAQSYYELLEVSVSASTAEIDAAFVRLSRLYGDDQMSLYGLVEPQRAKELKERLDEARQVLSNNALRAEYDKRIGLPPRAPSPSQPDASPVGQMGFEGLLPSPPPTSASSGDRISVAWVGAAIEGATPLMITPPSSVASAPRTATRTASGEAPPAPTTSSTSEPSRHAEQAASSAAPARSDVPPPSMSPAPAPASSAPRAVEAAPPPVAAEPAASSALATTPARPQEEPPPPSEKPRPVEIPDGAVFNGALLKRVREARGLTLQVVSERTRIGVRHLENLEGDKYAALPAMVYLRGMLMSLSRELGIDGLKVSKSYLSLVEQAKG